MFLVYAAIAVTTIVVIAVVVFIVNRTSATEDPVSVYEALAEKYGGAYTLGGQFNNDYLSLPYKGSDLNVTYYSGSRDSISGFSAKLETSEPHLGEIFLFVNKSIKNAPDAGGSDRTLTGDVDFDRFFLVRSRDAAFVRRVFTEQVRKILLQKI